MARSESFYAVDKFIVVIGGNIRPGFWRYKDWSYLAVERPLLALPEFSVCPDSRTMGMCAEIVTRKSNSKPRQSTKTHSRNSGTREGINDTRRASRTLPEDRAIGRICHCRKIWRTPYGGNRNRWSESHHRTPRRSVLSRHDGTERKEIQ
jgi:hypothetical protein